MAGKTSAFGQRTRKGERGGGTNRVLGGDSEGHIQGGVES